MLVVDDGSEDAKVQVAQLAGDRGDGRPADCEDARRPHYREAASKLLRRPALGAIGNAGAER